MNLKVIFFGKAKEIAGKKVEIPFKRGMKISELKELLSEKLPELKPILSSCAIALNGNILPEDEEIKKGDEVAVLPPVSGGIW